MWQWNSRCASEKAACCPFTQDFPQCLNQHCRGKYVLHVSVLNRILIIKAEISRLMDTFFTIPVNLTLLLPLYLDPPTNISANRSCCFFSRYPNVANQAREACEALTTAVWASRSVFAPAFSLSSQFSRGCWIVVYAQLNGLRVLPFHPSIHPSISSQCLSHAWLQEVGAYIRDS